jgi:hypothetical protein
MPAWARNGEQAVLGRRLQRGQQFCAREIATNKQMNKISLARIPTHPSKEYLASMVGETQAMNP